MKRFLILDHGRGVWGVIERDCETRCPDGPREICQADCFSINVGETVVLVKEGEEPAELAREWGF
jgi:uncharacterized protein YuzB (UPF0349 family)